MKIKSCKFIEATEIFRDCPAAWEMFANSDPECSWGNNNRTMVTPDVIVGVIEDVYDDDEFVTVEGKQVRLVFDRLEALEDHVYVDLEN
jgi:hypothetical protein